MQLSELGKCNRAVFLSACTVILPRPNERYNVQMQ